MKDKSIKIKKIESILSQKIGDIYLQQLEHKIESISYKLFDRTLIITLEGTVTSPEKLLQDNNRLDLAREIRQAVDRVIQPQIRAIIEEVLEVRVVDFLSDTTINSNITAAIAIFEFKPKDI